MKNFLKILKKVIEKTDYFYFTLITISLITALLIEDGSWRLILFSISILFIVALISSLAQKFTEYYENVPRSMFNSEVDYEVTTKSSELGTRQTIENFDSNDDYPQPENSEESEPDQKKTKLSTVQQLSGINFDEEYSGVRIIRTKPSTALDDKSTSYRQVELKIEDTELEEVHDLASKSNNDTLFQVPNFTKNESSVASLTEQTDKEIVKIEETKFESTNVQIEESPSLHETKPNDILPENYTESVYDEPTEYFEEKISSEQTVLSQIVDNKEIITEFPKQAFFENLPYFGDEPKKELEYFISRTLLLIKSTVTVNTVGLFLYNSNHDALKLYSYITENEEFLNKDAVVELKHDILSEIQRIGKPEILTSINYASVLDILPYYNKLIEIKSFAGIPIFQKDKVIGVLTLDSFEPNAFDKNLVGYLGHYTKLLASLLSSLNEKFELMISSKTLDAIINFRSMLVDENISFDNILSAAFDTIKTILGFENIGFCNYSKQTNNWKIQAIQGNQNFVNAFTHKIINTKNAIITNTLFKNEVNFYAPISNRRHIVLENEPFNSEGYFISVPLKSINSSYGSIFVYGDNYENVSRYDSRILKVLSEHIASTIEKYLYINIFQNYAYSDPFTGILNPNSIHSRLIEEIDKAKDFEFNLSFLTIKIDDYHSFQNNTGLQESMQKLIIDIIKAKLNKYDIFGKLDDTILGVVVLKYNKQDIRLWADQLRTEIANKFITFNNQRYMVTVSIGIAFLQEDDTIETLTSKSIQMLKESSLKKNSINLY